MVISALLPGVRVADRVKVVPAVVSWTCATVGITVPLSAVSVMVPFAPMEVVATNPTVYLTCCTLAAVVDGLAVGLVTEVA
jgi:putative Mn2+ efflux pump MntP